MPISAQNLCRIAGELAAEHGELAADFARRTYREMESVGESERAQVWLTLSVLADDILRHGLDPDGVPSIN